MGITVVAFLVGCAPGLLVCEEIPTGHLRFHDAGDCRAELPRMIDFYRGRRSDLPVVMGKCRYYLDHPKPNRDIQDDRQRLLS